MSKLSIGQEVVCIDDKPMNGGRKVPLRKGNTYVIQDICYCSKCGGQFVDVGLVIDNQGGWECVRCKVTVIPAGSYIWWFGSTRFAPKEEAPPEQEQKEEAQSGYAPVTFTKIQEGVPAPSQN